MTSLKKSAWRSGSLISGPVLLGIKLGYASWQFQKVISGDVAGKLWR